MLSSRKKQNISMLAIGQHPNPSQPHTPAIDDFNGSDLIY